MTKHMTLGELIKALKERPFDQEVRFDFPGQYPTRFSSYRGYYEDLALRYTDCSADTPTVEDLLQESEKVLGEYLTGYKGGEYLMTAFTRVWVSEYGDSSGVALVGVTGDRVTVLQTAWYE